MAEPDDLGLTILREMRREMSERFDAVEKHLGEHDKALAAIRDSLKSETIWAGTS